MEDKIFVNTLVSMSKDIGIGIFENKNRAVAALLDYLPRNSTDKSKLKIAIESECVSIILSSDFKHIEVNANKSMRMLKQSFLEDSVAKEIVNGILEAFAQIYNIPLGKLPLFAVSEDQVNPNEKTISVNYSTAFNRNSSSNIVSPIDANPELQEIEERCKTELSYILTGGGYAIRGIGDYKGSTLVIPASIKTVGDGEKKLKMICSSSVAENGEEIGPFEYCDQIEKLYIAEGIEYISENAFRGCKNLTEIYLPKTMKTIARGAFVDCNIKNVFIWENVTDFGYNVFKGNPDLTSFNIDPNNSEYVSIDNALYSKDKKTLIAYLGNAKSFTIPEGVEEIADSCFYRNASLKEISFPDTLRKIGHYAFLGCEKIDHILLPDNVEHLGEQAFGDCLELKTITLPKNLTEEGMYDETFIGCEKLTRIVLPRKITQLNNICSRCSSLEKITIPAGVQIIGCAAFEECINLETVEIPYGIQEIQDCAFSKCSKIENIDIPYGIKSIGCDCFSDCTRLNTITIAGSLEELSFDVFLNCLNLRSIIFKGTKAQWKKIKKDKSWNNNTGKYTVYCNDGKLAKIFS